MLEVAKPQPLTRPEEPSKKEESKPLVKKVTPETGRAIQRSEKEFVVFLFFSLNVSAPTLMYRLMDHHP